MFVARRLFSSAAPTVNGQALFAVVHLAGHQYKVTVGDVLTTQRLVNANVGERLKVDKVLMMGSSHFTTLGTPLVADASVTLAIEEQTKGDKILVFKKKRRKRYERQYGHRQDVTIVRVTAIESPHASQTEPVALRPAAPAPVPAAAAAAAPSN
jgi:large subunit ribosomal protein L21